MKKNSEDVPIACRLSDSEFRRREATLLAQFKSSVVSEEELPDGYAFTVPSDNESTRLLEQLIAAESECCPFLKFEMTAKPGSASFTLRVAGPSGAKEFVRTVFCKRRNQG